MFNKRNPSPEELAKQRDVLKAQITSLGINPDEIPEALQKMQKEIEEQIKALTSTIIAS